MTYRIPPDTNIGMGMAPHRPACQCLDCGNDRLRHEVRRLRAEVEELRDLLDEAHAYLFEIESVKSRTGYSGRDVWLSDFLNRICAAMEKEKP